ncbi:amidase family protein [Actinokineospora cianjurensis]|uniref:Asp-tRNA(Asn)/Glu-tRNA(Gln) amidotransferase A subunit family amidase n=1 Tax=Actinokineospora cianjurensis TaxID=585224 RepID=A0A421BBW0_9PSEU|nr:amidase family protein [Actinokineospora cianjurensis]RLK61826.1 Asp-tRNA(Asn)/Glu-tRNA(Gln) amidotransferase A subunit family amidase [Actinokineospora cianjurensis]
MIADYLATSGTDIARLVTTGQVSAVEVARMALGRWREVDGRLNAFQRVAPDEVIAAAREVDRRLRDGEVLPLAGVPIGVKLGERRVGKALVAAGCVVLGTTSVPGPGTPWRTWGRTDRGLTRNPWRADRTPGGSSAGSGAAVAAGVVPLATGADGAGSVRIPAAWCGVTGVKITSDTLVTPGILGAWSTDIRTSLELLLRRRLPLRDRMTRTDAGGLTAAWSADLGFADTEDGQAAVARAAVGVPLVEVSVELLDPREAWFAYRAGEAVDLAENRRRLAEVFERVDLILTPTTPGGPHGHGGPGGRMSTALTWLFNLTGHPAASVPVGFAADGCPVGVQVIARGHREQDLLGVLDFTGSRNPLAPC